MVLGYQKAAHKTGMFVLRQSLTTTNKATKLNFRSLPIYCLGYVSVCLVLSMCGTIAYQWTVGSIGKAGKAVDMLDRLSRTFSFDSPSV